MLLSACGPGVTQPESRAVAALTRLLSVDQELLATVQSTGAVIGEGIAPDAAAAAQKRQQLAEAVSQAYGEDFSQKGLTELIDSGLAATCQLLLFEKGAELALGSLQLNALSDEGLYYEFTVALSCTDQEGSQELELRGYVYFNESGLIDKLLLNEDSPAWQWLWP